MANQLGLSLAPMMERTTAPFRQLARFLNANILLYTEMINAQAIIYGDHERLLAGDLSQGSLVLQLGCHEPEDARKAVEIAETYSFSAYNLNLGCPSERVQHRLIGAALMAQPERVSDILRAMRSATNKPITIKQRLGIQSRQLDLSSYHDLLRFTRQLAPLVDGTTVHARIAILEGLSPKENRTIPPLRYADVLRLQQDLPQLTIELNGGICSLAAVQEHQRSFAALMLGRWPWDNSWSLAQLGHLYGGTPAQLNRQQVLSNYLQWLDGQCLSRRHLSYWLNPLHNLFHSLAYSRRWRQSLSPPKLDCKDPRLAIQRAMTTLPRANLAQTVSESL